VSADGRRLQDAVKRPPRLTGRPRARLPRKSEPARLVCPVAMTIPTLDIRDDCPEAIPVDQRELEVIETYLGALLDDFF
jgi:hypothetical protein